MSFLKGIGTAVKAVGHALGSAAKAVGHFFADAWAWEEKTGAKLGVAIVEEAKVILMSPGAGMVASIADGLLHTQIPTEILDALKARLPNALAIAAGVQGVVENPSDEEITALEQRVLEAFKVSENKSRFYTTLGAEVQAIIRKYTMPGQVFNFIELSNDLEAAYQKYLIAKAEDDATSQAA